MNIHEIEIYYIKDYDQMNAICHALYEGNIDGEDIDDIGIYLQEGKPDSVFVEYQNLNDAVNIINKLGYETDED